MTGPKSSMEPQLTPLMLGFEDLYDHAPCGYIVADKNFRILCVNGTLAQWVASEPSAFAGQHFSELLSIGSRLYFETHFAPMLRMSGSLSEVALDLAWPTGAKLPVIINAVERRDESGMVIAILIILFAATERRTYERGLVAARNSAERVTSEVRTASELREELVAILGHDLRNPVFALSSGIKILKRETLSGRAQKVISLMEGSVVRASVLIENVLDFARGRLGGGIKLKLQDDKPLGSVIEHVVAEMRLIAPERQFVVEIDQLPVFSVDSGRMGQLFSNLLGNAVTHGAAELPIRVKASVNDGVFEFSVANAGIPIPADIMANLFAPFFRGKDVRDKHGLGLGLHIAMEIAKAHGGALQVSSSIEETRFTCQVPITPSGVASSAV